MVCELVFNLWLCIRHHFLLNVVVTRGATDIGLESYPLERPL